MLLYNIIRYNRVETRAVRKNRRKRKKNPAGGRREFRILDNFELPVPPPVGRRPCVYTPRRDSAAVARQRQLTTEGRRPEPYMAGRPRAGPKPWLRWRRRRPHRRRPENSVLCPPSHSHVWAAAAGIFGPGPFIKPPVPTSRTFISTSTADQQPHTSRRPVSVSSDFFRRKPVSSRPAIYLFIFSTILIPSHTR